MVTELEEMANALVHQAHACSKIVEHGKRTHAFSIIQLLSSIQNGLARRNQKALASDVEKMVATCTNCISTTSVAGKAYKCIKEDTKKLKGDAGAIANVRWEPITFEEPKLLKKK